LVAGATYPEELRLIRQIAPATFLLIPGVGKQLGNLEESVRFAYNPDADADFALNVSSAVLYAFLAGKFQREPAEFDSAAAAAAKDYHEQIQAAIASVAASA
jgi:orotidine-5'-phosphate decarboxylase